MTKPPPLTRSPKRKPHFHLAGAVSGVRTGHGLARILSKLGYCSRSQAWPIIKAGRVTVDGVVRLDPEWRVESDRQKIQVDGKSVLVERKVYLMLNKPRGLVTTAADEKGRETVFACLESKALPRVAPVGRLDMASEGLLLFTNDTQWAARITDPLTHLDKIYHVQVDSLPTDGFLEQMHAGVVCEGEKLSVKNVRVLRQGEKNCWLEIVLDEGRNRHIRRLLEALDTNVLRLIRIAIGPLVLGNLGKGEFRMLTAREVSSLS